MERTTRSSGKNTIQIDRLSALPDDVVCHILSFLPTKLSVATSILATRWRLLWTHVPNLEFVSRYGYDSHSELKIRNDRFTDIVNSAMLLYKAGNMNTFRLFHIVGKGCTKSQLETWITAAIAHNVKKLHLSLIGRAILPSCIFTCETLVDLRLRFGGEIPMTGTVYLPALKSLHLDSINYESDETLPHLLSVCPLLEELTIIDSIELFKARYITSPTIKRLVLKADFYGRGQRGACNMKIDTPALTYLRLDGFVPADISEETLASLIQVEIVFDECTLLGEAHLYCHSVLQFVGRAKCLKLSSNGLRKLPESAFSDLAIKFGNLTKLELATVWCPLTYFLENADKLEVLIINEPLLSWSDTNQKTWMEPVEQCPACLYSLRTITFDNFRCEERQFKIVGYLAKNAKVLKKIEIHFCPYLICLKRKFDAVKRISMFELGSKACQLVFN